jgi:hypothetical protein
MSSILKPLQRLISRLLIWVAPVLLILISIFINLPNNQLHKETLAKSDFYNKLSSQLQQSEVKAQDGQVSFGSVLYASVLRDVASPGWLQNLFEQNIDNTTKWLKGENDELVLYLPSKDIELAASKQLDNKVKELSENSAIDIETCTQGQIDTIEREGFALNSQVCLPESVKNGEQTLTEFLDINEQAVETGEFFSSLIRNSPFNTFTNNYKPGELPRYSDGLIGLLNQARDLFISGQKAIPFVLMGLIMAFALQLVLARFANRKVLSELRKTLFYTSLGIFSLSGAVILTIGGSVYFTSYLQELFLPGIQVNELTQVVSFEAVKFAFNLISYAFWLAVGMITANFILQYGEVSGFFANTEEKNQLLKKFEKEKPAVIPTPTFDAAFKNSLNQQPNHAPQPQPAPQPIQQPNPVYNNSIPTNSPTFQSPDSNPVFNVQNSNNEFKEGPKYSSTVITSEGVTKVDSINYNKPQGFQGGFQRPPSANDINNNPPTVQK